MFEQALAYNVKENGGRNITGGSSHWLEEDRCPTEGAALFLGLDKMQVALNLRNWSGAGTQQIMKFSK